ncbi:hypothetical protein PHMEG_0007009 [Phytophthora megakarya]|uniref:Uncharacterized protein n=1 Tax=Phytophthora megakarya TaxID=4795 RepID=A0A225WMG6_9STRA|nr:hypothetical protein PHMEG_0007009 [Phytophthora megakarya]
MIDGFLDNIGNRHLVQMLNAAKKDPESEKLATNLEDGLIDKWMADGLKPEELKRKFSDVNPAEEMIARIEIPKMLQNYFEKEESVEFMFVRLHLALCPLVRLQERLLRPARLRPELQQLPRTANLKPLREADVVELTEEGEPWTATSARRVSDLPPLHSSKRAAAKSVGEVPPTDGRKGKRKTAKRVPPVASKKRPRVATAVSESEREEKTPAPTTKRPKKTLVPATEMSSMPDDPRATVTSSRAEGFGLNSFLDSFQPVAAVPATTTCSSQPETVSARVEEAASTPEALSLLEELRALNTEVHQHRVLVGASEGAVAVCASVTVANTKGELPPTELPGKFKAKGDYNPRQAHMLAASRMFRTFVFRDR